MQTITFLNWDKPLINPLVDHLLALGDDLVNHVIIVPTAQSSRQLRKALAHAELSLAPRVTTPEILNPIHRKASGFRAAKLTAWTEALMGLNLSDAQSLFPSEPPEGVSNGFRWAFNVGKQLSELEQSLHESGKSFLDISRLSMEPERWQDLTKIGREVKKSLRSWNIQIQNEYQPISTKQHHKKIIVAGVCDLSPQATERLNQLINSNTSVEIVVHAPEHLRCHFDEWGRPNSEYWSTTDIEIPDWQDNIIVAETPSLAAKHIIQEVATEQLNPDQVTLGLCDRDMLLSTKSAFSSAGWKLYDPAGTKVNSSSLILFLDALAEWISNRSTNKTALSCPLSAYAKILRLPEIEVFLPENTDRYSLIRELDLCLEKRMPIYASDLNEYLNSTNDDTYPNLTKSLQHFLTETDKMLTGSKIRGLRGWLAKILNRTSPEIASILVDEIAEIFDVLEKIEKHSNKNNLVISQVIEILIDTLADKKSYQKHADNACDLLGWIDLMFENAPQLYIIGLHEGEVPEYRGDDPFLPDSFRESIGMYSGSNYFARDSYLLHSLIQSRAKTRIIISKLSESNEPKTPSRLLLRSTGKELASRVTKLFGEPLLKSENPSAWQRDWQLNIPNVPNPYSLKIPDDIKAEDHSVRSLSPSALKDYLHCPFRFFLKRVVRMRRFDANKSEMNALDFGLLVHAITENFGRDGSICDSTSARDIQNYFDDQLAAELFKRYGAHPNLAIKMQAEIAQSRLHKLASMQAEEAKEGWRIIDVELDIGPDNDIPWEINGHPIQMQVDRVDRNIHTGKIRVLDYKTSAKNEAPTAAHISKFDPNEDRPLCGALLPKGSKNGPERYWKNLQLPIYAWFAQQHYHTDEIPDIGYINLPKTISESSFQIWENFDGNLLTSAQEWTTNAITKIQKADFFTPANLTAQQQAWDDFGKLAQGDIAEAFALTSESRE